MYEQEIKEYISNNGLKPNTEKYLLFAVDLFAETGINYPELDKRLKPKLKNPTIRKNTLDAIKGFFKTKETRFIMSENVEEFVDVQPVESVQPVQEIPENLAKTEKPSKPRKSEKIMIYVTPDLFSDIQDMAYLNRKPMAGFVTSVLESYISNNQDRLQKFRSL